MTAPTEANIRKALVHRLENGDHYASDADWISYLSDGLDTFWPGERMPNGDRVTNMEPELEAMIDAATARIARQCHELAITELTKIAATYRDRIERRDAYRAVLAEEPASDPVPA